jgi:hypothetical protein
MTDPTSWDGAPVADEAPAADALERVDALLARGACRGRPVRYALDGDPTALTRDEVEAWLTGAEAEGLTRVRYRVDARGGGPVLVALSARAGAA